MPPLDSATRHVRAVDEELREDLSAQVETCNLISNGGGQRYALTIWIYMAYMAI